MSDAIVRLLTSFMVPGLLVSLSAAVVLPTVSGSSVQPLTMYQVCLPALAGSVIAPRVSTFVANVTARVARLMTMEYFDGVLEMTRLTTGTVGETSSMNRK